MITSMRWAVLAKEGVSAGAYLVCALFWLLPIGGYYALRAFRRRIPGKLQPLQELLTLEDRAGFINGIGELVKKETPNPRYLRGVLPERNSEVTDVNCYTYWHDQFLYQQRSKYANPVTKVFDSIDNIITVGFALFILVAPPVVAGKYWWFIFLFVSLPVSVIASL
jgi:hypothetical protein